MVCSTWLYFLGTVSVACFNYRMRGVRGYAGVVEGGSEGVGATLHELTTSMDSVSFFV